MDFSESYARWFCGFAMVLCSGILQKDFVKGILQKNVKHRYAQIPPHYASKIYCRFPALLEGAKIFSSCTSFSSSPNISL